VGLKGAVRSRSVQSLRRPYPRPEAEDIRRSDRERAGAFWLFAVKILSDQISGV
jgi:hypothetical protein